MIGREDGHWALVQTVPEIENDLPATVRSMIQRKIAQLGDADRRLLVAASVQGCDLRLGGRRARAGDRAGEVEERLQGARPHVRFRDVSRRRGAAGSHAHVRYRFVHVLYQNALYATLTPSRRAALSAGDCQRAARVPRRGQFDQSRRSWRFCFRRRATFRGPRSIPHRRPQRRADLRQPGSDLPLPARLDMNRRVPDSPERARQELQLQMTLGPSLMTVKGFGHRNAADLPARAELCEQAGDDEQLFRVLFGLSIVSVVRAEYAKAQQFAEQCLRLAERGGEAALLVQAHWVLGLSLQFIGDFTGAREHLERSRVICTTRSVMRRMPFSTAPSQSHAPRARAAVSRLPEPSAGVDAEGLRVAEQMRHPLGLCNTLSVAVTIEAFHGNSTHVMEMTERMLFHADEHGLPYYAGIGTIMRGWARAMRGETRTVAEMRAGLAAHRTSRPSNSVHTIWC